jgi:hypothetical protein
MDGTGTLLSLAVVEPDGRVELIDAGGKSGRQIETQADSFLVSRTNDGFLSETVEALLKAGAKIDSKDKHGNTPLMTAVSVYRGGQGTTIRLLRKMGADPSCRNNYGISPVESARMTGNYDTAKYFDDLPK